MPPDWIETRGERRAWTVARGDGGAGLGDSGARVERRFG